MEGLKKKLVQRTLVLIKPDGVSRGLVGEILTRFERAGLRIVGLGIVEPKKSILQKHYPKKKSWLENLGKHTIDDLKALGISDPLKFCQVKSAYELGLKIRTWLIDFMLSGPIVKIALEGPNAISVVRKIVGLTIPAKASPGTIRGDYSSDLPFLANLEKRAVKNLIHASGNEEEAIYELSLWFRKEELLS